MKLTKLLSLSIFTFLSLSVSSQCTVTGLGSTTTTSGIPMQDTIIVACADSVVLSVAGQGFGSIAFQETFNNGQPIGWNFSQETCKICWLKPC